MSKVQKIFLLSLIILCGCREKVPTFFYKDSAIECPLDQIKQLFPIPFYEMSTVRCVQEDLQTIISGIVVDSLNNVKEFLLIHADQGGWCLDFEMSFQNSFLLSFKKAGHIVVVIGAIHAATQVRVEIYIKS